MKVYVLYENEEWMPPLRKALAQRNLETEEIFLNGGVLDFGETPKPGVYINRMSPSSHTRGHQAGVRFAKEYLTYLESFTGCRLINGSQAFRLEVSKVHQYAALEAFGIRTPRTIAVTGTKDMGTASRVLKPPFITKHNQGGKGLGVQLFRSHEGLDEFLKEGSFQDSPDGINLLQQYIEPAEAFITRVEMVDGQFLYAIRSSTEDGFELCPADACEIGDAFCPAPDSKATADEKFRLRHEITAEDPLVKRYLAFMKAHEIEVAGIEFVEDSEGNRYTYDINSTSNYNGKVEAKLSVAGMDAIAVMAERELQCLIGHAAA
ncbi:MAG: alpha-L-glutamate ligase [Myxococcota bacterium]|nr:alpha-L-glutamate ligase [Myxococcota bacterium]